eukprot:g60030.t1
MPEYRWPAAAALRKAANCGPGSSLSFKSDQSIAPSLSFFQLPVSVSSSFQFRLPASSAEREASRDVLLRRHTFLARTGALPRLCWNNSEDAGGGGDVATACVLHWGLPDGCRTARDLDFAPAREGEGGGPRRCRPGCSRAAEPTLLLLPRPPAGARGQWDPTPSCATTSRTGGGLSLRLEGVTEPSTCNCRYAVPSLKYARSGDSADGIWGGDELLQHEPLLVEGADGAPCSRLVFASPWSWAAYWSWRSLALLDAFTHWPGRVAPRWTATRSCTDLNKPLWHLEPVRLAGGDGAGVWTSCYQALCPQPVSASFDWVKSQLQGLAREEDQGQPLQAVGSSWAAPDPDPDAMQRDTNQPPCGWDRGLCLAQQVLCSCYSDFRALRIPNTDPALLSLGPNGKLPARGCLQPRRAQRLPCGPVGGLGRYVKQQGAVRRRLPLRPTHRHLPLRLLRLGRRLRLLPVLRGRARHSGLVPALELTPELWKLPRLQILILIPIE